MSRALDALFAERVMGWPLADGSAWDESGTRLFSPSTSLDDAWKGVERLADGSTFHPALSRQGSPMGEVWAFSIREVYAVDTSPARAITRACLLAAGCTPEEIAEAEK